jgi:hypothetical protein
LPRIRKVPINRDNAVIMEIIEAVLCLWLIVMLRYSYIITHKINEKIIQNNRGSISKPLNIMTMKMIPLIVLIIMFFMLSLLFEVLPLHRKSSLSLH